MKWMPIESAPVWQLVIVYDPSANKRKSAHKVNVAVQVGVGVWALGCSGYIPSNPTHWMPLPEPPPQEKADDR